MTPAKWTRGPWQRYPGMSDIICGTDLTREIAHVKSDDWSDEDDANAALLVCAPEMYEALEAMLAAAPAFRSGTIGAPGSEARARQDAHIAAEDAARAVLRKAKGE